MRAASVNDRSARPSEEELEARLQMLGLSRPYDPHRFSTLETLRQLMPRRALTWREAERIAERQADRLRELLDLGDTPRLAISRLAELPFLRFANRDGFPTSGMAVRRPEGWTIVIRADEPKARRRYTVCHEFKHIIDDELTVRLEGGLYPSTHLYTGEEIAERVADRFAAALLMPKALLRRDWTDGNRDIGALARRYDVSRMAMYVRLSQLGLLEPIQRCA